VINGNEPDLTSASNPAGIKIGGSYPQNTQEFNAFNGRFDDLMFFDKTLSAEEVGSQYARFLDAPPHLRAEMAGSGILFSWSSNSAGFELESCTNLHVADWTGVEIDRATNAGMISVTVPIADGSHYFRLRR